MIKRIFYLDKIRPVMNDPLIKVIMGMRRVGKSTLLLQIQEELQATGVQNKQIISINFENLRYDSLRQPVALYEFLSGQLDRNRKYYLFIDEIQEVSGFERVINSLTVEYDVDIYITGSNSKLLSSELATVLTGRFISIEVLPLSFREILTYDSGQKPEETFISWLKQGGLPAILRLQDNPDIIRSYLQDMYSSILLKDIVGRFNIRDVDLLERFVKYLLQNVGQIFSASSITKFMKSDSRSIARETIYQYLSACKSAYLFHGVPRFDIRGKQILKTSEKYYVNDLGLRSIYFDNEEDIGQALENLVYLELRRQGYEIFVGQLGDFEVDFIAVKGQKQLYIQVAYLLASEETLTREFAPLLAIRDNYPKYVISMDRIKRSQKGIIHLNVIDFLLDFQKLTGG